MKLLDVRRDPRHLQVLLTNALVIRSRDGYRVLCSRATAGDQLLSSN